MDKKKNTLQPTTEFRKAVEYIATLRWSDGTPQRHLMLHTLIIMQDYYKSLPQDDQTPLDLQPIDLVNWYIKQAGWDSA